MGTFRARPNLQLVRGRPRTQSGLVSGSGLYIFLSEEEKRLGLDLEQLTAIEHEIDELNAWIARQQKIAGLKRGTREAASAKTLLDMLYRLRGLCEKYRWIVLTSIRHRLDRA